jgi:anti-anti-sigma factor
MAGPPVVVSACITPISVSGIFTEHRLGMNQKAYQIERDRRVLVARPGRVQCTGTDIATLVLDLCHLIDMGDADSVVVELSNVQHMDSCCLGRIIALHQHTRAAGGSVALAQCQPNVEFLFKMTRLDKVMGLYSTTEYAIAELRDRRTRPKPRPKSPHGFVSDTPHAARKTRGYAPLLAALIRAHKRIHAPDSATREQRLHPGSH